MLTCVCTWAITKEPDQTSKINGDHIIYREPVNALSGCGSREKRLSYQRWLGTRSGDLARKNVDLDKIMQSAVVIVSTYESQEHPTSLVSARVKLKFDTNVTEKVKTCDSSKSSVSYIKI